jgi:hypothetical protein
MLDAELNEGDLGQVTQAIQNALRPATPNAPRAIAQRIAPANEEVITPQSVGAEIDDSSEQAEVPDVQAKPTGPRKFRTPKVLDLDLRSGVSFQSFAQSKNPPSDQTRFLVVAAWFKLHHDTESITVDHVYTCYRHIGWPSAIEDFSAPLRALKGNQLLERTKKGSYAINQLGMARVDKLGG